MSIESVGDFLKTLDLTSGSHIFMIDDYGAIGVTTHPAEFRTFSTTTNPAYTPPPNCGNGAVFAKPETTTFTISCRSYAKDFPYPPLQAAAQVRDLMKPTTETIVFRKLTVGGEIYYAASVKVPNAVSTFPMFALLLLPQRDVIGDIVQSRNVVIGIVAAVMVLAVIPQLHHHLLDPAAAQGGLRPHAAHR
jgi:hypothetical protein